MKKAIVALILGIAWGYYWGYGDATDGKGSVVSRTLDHFGASRLKQAQTARERTLQDAAKP